MKQRARILVVSDDRMTRTIVGFSLALEDFEVKESSDANAALRELSSGFEPDLVICGCGPWPEGAGLLKGISGLFAPRRSPVLAVVASREDLDRQMEWKEAGAACLLATPFSSEQLLEMARMVLFENREALGSIDGPDVT